MQAVTITHSVHEASNQHLRLRVFRSNEAHALTPLSRRQCVHYRISARDTLIVNEVLERYCVSTQAGGFRHHFLLVAKPHQPSNLRIPSEPSPLPLRILPSLDNICAVLLTAIGVSAPARDRRLGTLPIVSYLLGGAVGTIAPCAFALVCGTTFRGVISGIILMPLQMMSAFGQGPLTSDSRPEAALSLLIAVFYFLALRRGLRFSSVAVAVLKLIFAATVIAPVLLGRSVALQGWGLFLWIVLVPLPESEGEAARGGETGRVDLSRLSLVLLAASSLSSPTRSPEARSSSVRC